MRIWSFNVGDKVRNHFHKKFDGVIVAKFRADAGNTFYHVADKQGKIWHRDPRDLTLIEAANE